VCTGTDSCPDVAANTEADSPADVAADIEANSPADVAADTEADSPADAAADTEANTAIAGLPFWLPYWNQSSPWIWSMFHALW